MQFQAESVDVIVTGADLTTFNVALPETTGYILDFKRKSDGLFSGRLLKAPGFTTVPFKSSDFSASNFDVFASNLKTGVTELHVSLDQEISEGRTINFETIVGSPASVATSRVAGVVQIDGDPAGRLVRAFTYNSETMTLLNREVRSSRPLGEVNSDPETGAYELTIESGYSEEIFVIAFDDYGKAFTPNLTVSVGHRIHPTTPNGYIWECTGSGTLPSEEPTWVIDTETAQLYGTASMIARPFYRPVVHGPVNPEVIAPDPAP